MPIFAIITFPVLSWIISSRPLPSHRTHKHKCSPNSESNPNHTRRWRSFLRTILRFCCWPQQASNSSSRGTKPKPKMIPALNRTNGGTLRCAIESSSAQRTISQRQMTSSLGPTPSTCWRTTGGVRSRTTTNYPSRRCSFCSTVSPSLVSTSIPSTCDCARTNARIHRLGV